jgi:general stress protein CsbA
MGVLGGSIREYPLYFAAMVVFAFIAMGYLDARPWLIVLSVLALVGAYVALDARRQKRHTVPAPP